MGAAELAVALEARGFDIVWAPSIRISAVAQIGLHHGRRSCPSGTTTPWIRSDLDRGGGGDPTLKVGTGSAWSPSAIRSRSPAGRLDRPDFRRALRLRVGNGWNRDEMENHGTDFAQPPQARGRISRR
jgi:hypothetical protein